MFFKRKKPQCPICEERTQRLHSEIVFFSQTLDKALEKQQETLKDLIEMNKIIQNLHKRVGELEKYHPGLRRDVPAQEWVNIAGPPNPGESQLHWDRGDQIG